MIIQVIKPFLNDSSVYSCYLILISSASVRSIPFLSFIVPIFVWNIPLVFLIFLKRSLVSHILLFSSICIDHWGRFLISPCYSLELGIQTGVSFLFSLPFASLLFSAICEASPDNHFAFFAFFFSWGWSWSLPPIQCHEPTSIVLLALCLSDLGP